LRRYGERRGYSPDRSGINRLINRHCAQGFRVNAEDRLYGMISLSVRATISYRGGQFQRNMIDDAVQNSLGELVAACPTSPPPMRRSGPTWPST
jgi:hypothetical protein